MLVSRIVTDCFAVNDRILLQSFYPDLNVQFHFELRSGYQQQI